MEYGGLSECGSSAGEEEMIEELLVEGCWVETGIGTSSEVGNKRWWIGPRANTGPSSSVKDRLALAVAYLKEYTKNNNNVLIQIWVPLRRSSEGLALDYHTNPDHDSDSSFLSVPFPINPNHNHNHNLHLRFFRCHDYPRLPYDLPDSMAFPVFERGTAACLGLLHIQTIINYHYHSQLVLDHNNLSNAFEAVDLIRSCENFIPPAVKVFEELYEAAVNEIAEVMTCACKTHNLPLALTWAPCIQQKCGYGHSTDNYVSIVDSACYVGDVGILGFQEACSDCHLLRGQGIVGTAFTTSKPCFAIDITAFSKAEYPLAHHANMFGLNAAVAIPLRSVYTAVPADFVLEFFLPKDSTHDHKHILNSLSFLLQQACRTLHVVMDDEFTLPPPPPTPQVEPSSSSWISHMMEAQQKGKGTVCVSLECLEEPKEEFKVTTNWDQRRVGGDHQDSHTLVGRRSSSCSGGRKGGDQKRRTKAEKTISLQVLRQYFAGSLKDAAKSIGVCPTTLKRICRQHGITRWPSRKIKKVGHSLKKLQLVIDSVQGADGAIQIGSFYSSFPELNSATATATATAESSKSKKSDLKSPHSSSASTIINPAASASDVLISESPVLRSEAELHASASIQIQQEEDTKLFAPPILSDIASAWNSRALRVKATFADEKIRFSLQPFWGFRDLQLEIARRFNLSDMSNIVLKYLDDEGEWIVLACDGDLEECKDFHKSSQSRTIRLALFQASPLNLSNTFCNTSPS